VRCAALVLPLLLVGCVTHEVTVRQAPDAGDSSAMLPACSALIESRLEWEWRGQTPDGKPAPASATVSDPLPIDLALTAWTYAPDGRFRRVELLLPTPRPWWQRFPADLVTDLCWPDTLVVSRTAVAAPLLIAPRTAADLDAESARWGFGGRRPITTGPAGTQE
jgi:hypothetical protein